jgi:peptide/nickel transport system substrate-binding protein
MKKSIFIILFLILANQLIAQNQNKSASEELLISNNLSGLKGGQLILALLSNPKTFNPLFASAEQASSFITNMMFEGLVRINAITQDVEPALAKEWKVSNDGKEWIFYLRKGIKWSDGTPITADDVIFTLNTIYHPKISTPSKDILQINQQNLKGIKINDYTIKIILPQVYSPFLRQMEKNIFPVLPKHKWEKSVDNGSFPSEMNINCSPENIIVSGPYMLEKYIPGQRVILKSNPYYYKIDKNNKRLPYFDKIIINIINDYNSIYLKLISGEIDLWENLRPEDYSMLKSKAPEKGLELKVIGVSPGPEMLWFNLNNALNPKTKKKFIDEKKLNWFSNVLFRKAIAYAIDRETIIKNIYFQAAKPSYGLETESNKLWFNPNITIYKYDINKAKEYLTKAGFKLINENNKIKLIDAWGNEVKFTLNTNSENLARVNAANFIASDLKKIGITVNVQPLEFRSLVSKLMETFDYEAVLLAFTRPDLDPSSTMNVLLSSSSMHVWHPNQNTPASAWEKRIDELLNLQLTTYDFNLRKKYYAEVQKIMDDNIPIIYLYAPLAISVYKKNIKNIQCSILEPRCIWNIEELSW